MPPREAILGRSIGEAGLHRAAAPQLRRAFFHGLKRCPRSVNMLGIMKASSLRHVYTALMVLGLMVGLTLQGHATVSQESWATSVDLQVAEECDGCGDALSGAQVCPATACSAVGTVPPRADSFRSRARAPWRSNLKVGLLSGPEPHPPRRPLH